MTAAAMAFALAQMATLCIRADEAEDQAVKAIEQIGGIIDRDNKAKDKPIVSVTLISSFQYFSCN
jgi:hypothetical protein